MLVNFSNSPRSTMDRVDLTVGPTYSLLDKVRMNGPNSPKLLVKKISDFILHKFDTDRIKSTYIELRKGGIVFHFLSKDHKNAWAIPYHQLSVYQHSGSWTFHGNGKFIRVVNGSSKPMNKFLNKLFKLKRSPCGHIIGQGTGS